MINIKHFDLNILKIDKKSYKNIDIYYIGQITMKDSDYVKISNVSSLYLIIDKIDGCIEEKNGNKYLIRGSTDNNNELLIKYIKLWNEIKNSSEKINNKPREYGKDFMKIKFSSNDHQRLNKTLKIHNMTIVIRSIFEGDGKHYPQVSVDQFLYELEMLEYVE